MRRAKSNDNTSTARPPPRVRAGVQEPPVNKRRNPERASVAVQNLRPPSKEFGGPTILRSPGCQVPRLIMNSVTQDAIQRQTGELSADVLQQTPGFPSKCRRMRSVQGKAFKILWIVICDAIWLESVRTMLYYTIPYYTIPYHTIIYYSIVSYLIVWYGIV